MGQTYDWLRGLHILAVIAWIAGMLILPRIFVYHMRSEPGSDMEALFRQSERRTLRIIMNPAMILALLLGIGLIQSDAMHRFGTPEQPAWGFLLSPWMLVKLAGVVFLLGWHGFLSASRRRFEAGTNTRSERFWRLANEAPFLAAIVMVLAVTTEFGGTHL